MSPLFFINFVELFDPYVACINNKLKKLKPDLNQKKLSVRNARKKAIYNAIRLMETALPSLEANMN